MPLTSHKRNSGCGCLFVTVILIALVTAILGYSWYYWHTVVARGPVHVLVLGIDERSGEAAPFRSDTMILTRFDPRHRKIALMTIPRDLWVEIPGVGANRINAAHFFGGPALARQTVRSVFDVPVHYYVRLNFEAFTAIIDAMGGIVVDVPETLHDQRYPTAEYGVTTIHIEAGRQHMNGETALIYARSRYSTSDFDRARRQRQVLAAMKRKLSRPTTWLRLPLVAYAALTTIDSDLPLSEWPALTLISLRATEVEQLAIGPDETVPYTTNSGAAVLLPNWERINALLAALRR